MVREVVAIAPQVIARCSPAVALGCAGLGAILWITGARYSRSILALVAVASGTIIGMHLPTWCGWPIDGMSLAIGGAIALGACAFLMHRACIGLLLGAAMMLWAGLGTWIGMAGDVYWNCSAVSWHGDLVQLGRDAWQTLPAPIAHVFPLACFGGLAAGITTVVISAKLGKVLVHSLIGVTLMIGMGAIAAAALRPAWLATLPGTNLGQGLVLVGLVMAGAACQWRLTPPHRAAPGNASRTS